MTNSTRNTSFENQSQKPTSENTNHWLYQQIVSSPNYSEIASLSVSKCCPFLCSQQGLDGSEGRLQGRVAARLHDPQVKRRQHPARRRREERVILRGGRHPESHRGHGHRRPRAQIRHEGRSRWGFRRTRM